MLRFVETSVFTRALLETLDDEGYRQIQTALGLRPESGSVIRGSGGLRKLRWREGARGKRGGLRVIYHWVPSESVIYLLFMYRKSHQGDLTTTQLRALQRLVREELP